MTGETGRCYLALDAAETGGEGRRVRSGGEDAPEGASLCSHCHLFSCLNGLKSSTGYENY